MERAHGPGRPGAGPAGGGALGGPRRDARGRLAAAGPRRGRRGAPGGGLPGPHHGVWYDIETGTLLATNHKGGDVYEVDPATGTATELVSGFGDTTMAVRRPGEDLVYVSDRSSGVYTYDPVADSSEELVAISMPNGLLLGEEGVLYVSTKTGSLYEVDLDTGSETLLDSSLGHALGMCHDPAGGGILITIGSSVSGTIERYDLDAGSITTFSSDTSAPWDCAVHMPADADGDGYYSIFYGGTDCDDEDAAAYPGSGC